MNTHEAIMSRYACRKYTGEQLTKQELKALTDAANAAPVAMGDYSGYELVVVQDEEVRKAIDAGTAHAMPMMGDHPTYEAPTLLFVCIKPDQQFEMIPYCGASCIAENIMVQAADLGLASVYIMAVPTIMQGKQELLEKLGLSDGFIPVVLVSVGHAAEEHKEVKADRLKIRKI